MLIKNKVKFLYYLYINMTYGYAKSLNKLFLALSALVLLPITNYWVRNTALLVPKLSTLS